MTCMSKIKDWLKRPSTHRLLLAIQEQLNRMEQELHALRKQGGDIMALQADIQAAIDEATAAAAADADTTQSGITVLQMQQAKIEELLNSGANPAEIVAAIRGVNEAFKANTQKMADAIAAIPPSA